MHKTLDIVDMIVIAVYLIAVSGVGLVMGRSEGDTEDFFLAGRKMSWFMVFISVLGTEISALTFIGVPEEGFRRNFFYLQFAFGSLIGRYLVAYVLLPGFYERRINTIYGYLKNRFGSISHVLSSVFFFLTRVMASGVRIYAASLALSVASGWPLVHCLGLVVAIAVIYTFYGGLKAVMWTDLVQVIVFFGGAFIVLGYMAAEIPGGIGGIFTFVSEHAAATGENKLAVFRLSLDWGDPHTLLVSVIFGCVSTFAALGADHDMAQRLLTCRRMKDSQKAIILSGYATFPVVLLFLFLGTGLFVYFQTHPEFALPELSTKVFPFFIVEVLPRGLSGLLVAGVIAAAMSSLDSAMNALASTAVLDIYQPYIRPHASRKELMRVSRAAILVTASALMLFAWGCRGSEGVLFLGFKLVSFTYGAILGVFLLGILTRRGSDRGNAAAMLGSSLLVTALHFTQKALVDRGVLESAPVGWSWYLLIGTLATLGIGACFRGGGESGAR